MRVGVISDTHGLLRPEAIDALRGCSIIVHAGDVGAPDILPALRELAPVYAVRGNIDRESWTQTLPGMAWVPAGGARLYVCHRLEDVDQSVIDERCAAVIYGHSHKPAADRRGPVLYLNPGSAGPRRFSLPVTVARLEVEGRTVVGHELIHLA